jgi:hypothetical protein
MSTSGVTNLLYFLDYLICFMAEHEELSGELLVVRHIKL